MDDGLELLSGSRGDPREDEVIWICKFPIRKVPFTPL